MADERVMGDGLANDAVGGYYLHHVEAFDDGGGQCIPALALLEALVAGNMRVGVVEGDDRLERVTIRGLVVVATFGVEFGVSLGLNGLRDWKRQLAGENGGFRIVDVIFGFHFRHRGLILFWVEESGEF